jgi:hypothetical protein
MIQKEQVTFETTSYKYQLFYGKNHIFVVCNIATDYQLLLEL